MQLVRRYQRKYNPFYATAEKLAFAIKLSLHLTPAEEALWKRLKSRQLGVTFITQKVICGYIVDFYCHKYRLAIEVDGSDHDIEADRKRTLILNQVGVYVIRFTNSEVLNTTDLVVEKVRRQLEKSQKQSFAKPKKTKYQYPRLG